MKKIVALTLISLHCLSETTATKHSFKVKNEKRSIIAPIGTPFGFVADGKFTLTVYDFELSIKSHDALNSKKQKKSNKVSPETIQDGLHAGFLLKQFRTETEFIRFSDKYMENPRSCIFESFFERVEDDDVFNDDDDEFDSQDSDKKVVNKGIEIDGGIEHGLFLSMKHREKTWEPNTPILSRTFTKAEAGYYFLMYQVCVTGDSSSFIFKDILTTFELDLEFKNYDSFGNASYLTSGEQILPHMFFYLSISYAVLAFLWIRNLRGISSGSGGCVIDENERSDNKPVVFAIHHLMSVLLLLKTLSLFFESIRYHYIRVSGHAELWSVVYYSFYFLRGIFLFTLIMLIGSGWGFVKPILNKREKKVIYLVLVLQVIDNVALVILANETKGERLYADWSAVLHLVDILCCCAILIPIAGNITSLETFNNVDNLDETDNCRDESVRKASRLKLFRSFYLLVILYIYFTRIVVYLFASSLGYNYTWVRYLVSELATLTFYVTVGFKFQPMSKNPYFAIPSYEENQVKADECDTKKLQIELVLE